MRQFSITQAQLEELASLNDESADESRRKDEIVELVKTQELISASPQSPDVREVLKRIDLLASSLAQLFQVLNNMQHPERSIFGPGLGDSIAQQQCLSKQVSPEPPALG